MFQSNNVPDLEAMVNQWIKSEMNVDIVVYYVDITACAVKNQPDFPVVTACITYGPS